ncbi:Glycosyl hydrolases family 25 [Paenibacillus sp. UNC496MF]|nr:Glycosyl hydrolases family 25 [Paenibacillus sp. UNC496MF]
MQARRSSNVRVVDVSHHQGDIDWGKVSAGRVAGAFIKATEGATFVDPLFVVNAAAAAKAGLRIGFYHYAHPERNGAKEEAAHFVETIGERKADFPHVLDVEGEASKLGALTTWCSTWLKEVERLTGRPAMIYTGASFADTYLGKSLGKWPLWIAHYGVDRPAGNEVWKQWSVFQYTAKGRVGGIQGNADVNAMEKAFFDRYAGGTASVPNPAANGDVTIVANDKPVPNGRAFDGHAYLPLRQLGEALNVPVEWRAEEAAPYLGGKPVDSYLVVGGKTYVSLQTAAALLGGTASWDADAKTAYLNVKG